MTLRLEDLADDGCLWCGAEISMAHARSWMRRYCSRRCTNAYHNNLRKAAELEAKGNQDRQCAHCRVLMPASKRAGAIYCSSACKRRVLNARWQQRCRERAPAVQQQRKPTACRWCRRVFTPRQMVPPQVLCSQACNMAERRARSAPPALLSCIICSAEYRPTGGCLPRRTCSEPCKQSLKVRSRSAQRPTFQCEAVS